MHSLFLSLYRECEWRKLRSFNHRTCKKVLNLLEAIYLRIRKIVVPIQSYSSQVWSGQ